MKFCIHCGTQLDGKDCTCEGYKLQNGNKNTSKLRIKGKWLVGITLVALVIIFLGFLGNKPKESIIGKWNGTNESFARKSEFYKGDKFLLNDLFSGTYIFENNVLNCSVLGTDYVFYIKFINSNTFEVYKDSNQKTLLDTVSREEAK